MEDSIEINLTINSRLKKVDLKEQEVSDLLQPIILEKINKYRTDVHYRQEVLKLLEEGKRLPKNYQYPHQPFLACLFHEIRTPLNAIYGLMHQVCLFGEKGEEWQELMSLVKKSMKDFLICLYEFITEAGSFGQESNSKEGEVEPIIIALGMLEWFRLLLREFKILLPSFRKYFQEDDETFRSSKNHKIVLQKGLIMLEICQKYYDLLKTNEAVRFIDPQFAADFRKNF